ncbi:R3H domain-containing protein 2 [Mortierella sp. GBA43]|nr:R3H domain-containing protein 2 [Mortierella sp. GBA43]
MNNEFLTLSAVTAEDTTSSSQSRQEQSSDTQPKAGFTILRPGSGPSFNTPTGQASPTQTAPSSLADDQVSGLTASLEGLEVDDEANNTEDTGLDGFLVGLLKNRNERMFLLKLDLDFCNFLNNPGQDRLVLPSFNSYYRMVVHRVADYFKVTRHVGPQQKIILYKTEHSAIPPLRFSDLVEEEEEQPVKSVTVLKRNPNRPASGVSTPDLPSSEPDRKTLSIKEREEAYQKARARIFHEETSTKPKAEGSGPNSRSDSPSVSTPPTEVPRQDGAEDSAKSRARKQGNGRKQGQGSAKTPDEQGDGDSRQHSLPNSRNVSRSTSPSPDGNSKPGGNKGPKNKPSKGDLAAECADSKGRKSTTPSNPPSSPGTVRTPIGLVRTASSSSSQDGFQSPGIGPTPTESPTVNSPSNATGPKTYDYFGQNPTSSSGSVSPMSSGSSRTSFSHSQSTGSKNHRNYHGNSGGPSNNNFGNHTGGANFAKTMNAQPFVPKKPYSKHGNNHTNNAVFNNGPANVYSPGPPNQNHVFNSGASGSYTHPQVGASAPWPDRGMLPSHDASAFYNTQQDPSLPFQFGNNVAPYPQPGQNTHPSFNNNHHSTSNQHGYHGRARRSHSTKPQFGHQPHFQHPHHSRTHPPLQHHSNNFNPPSSGGDFVFTQGAQPPLRLGRPFESNPFQGSHQHYVPDFYPGQGMGGDTQGSYPMFPNQQLTTSPIETPTGGQRYSFGQKGSGDTNWNQGPNPTPGPANGNSFNSGQYQSKKNNPMHDYSGVAAAHDGSAKNSPETERPPSLSHILEIYNFDVQDEIFEDLVLPPGAKLRKLKPSGKDPNGQCLVVFKTGALASEALAAFQDGRESWMAPEANIEFKRSEPKDSSDASKDGQEHEAGDSDTLDQTRIQRRFNVRVWTPVLANTTPAGSTGTASPVKNQATSGTTLANPADAIDAANHYGEDHDSSDHGSRSSSSPLPSPPTASEPEAPSNSVK